jgi:hypothetical protein
MFAYALLLSVAVTVRLLATCWPVVTACAAIGAVALFVVLRHVR